MEAFGCHRVQVAVRWRLAYPVQLSPPPALTFVLTFIVMFLGFEVGVVVVLTIRLDLAAEVSAAASLDVCLDFHGSVPELVVFGICFGLGRPQVTRRRC